MLMTVQNKKLLNFLHFDFYLICIRLVTDIQLKHIHYIFSENVFVNSLFLTCLRQKMYRNKVEACQIIF